MLTPLSALSTEVHVGGRGALLTGLNILTLTPSLQLSPGHLEVRIL